MATAEEWREVVDEIARAAHRTRSPAQARLYRIAVDEGRNALRNFPPDIRGQADDLVHDQLYAKLDAIVGAASPRALFITMIRNAAIDVQRRQKRFVREDEPDAEPRVADEGEPLDEATAARFEAVRVVAALTARERQVFAAVASGEERDDIARVLGLSRAGVDQIVSRARKRLRGAS